jgi:nucleotide-binding universal stress UspA family protein
MSATRTISPSAIWDHVVCGIDGTPASLEAARQVARLMPASALTLCAVVDRGSIEGGVSLQEQLVREAEDALEQAQGEIAAVHAAEVHLQGGRPIRVLLAELAAEHATLVAVGSHRRTRATGIALGSVATAMLHDAPCSVLTGHGMARRDAPCGHEIVVDFDGSPAARRTLATGRELGARFSLKPA